MAQNQNLGEFEQIVLLAILRLNDQAYGVTIRREIQAHTERNTTPGALYTTLDRLEQKGFVASRLGDPTPERGGRAKRFYVVSPAGREAVERAQRSYRSLMDGLRILVDGAP
ncbi:MAG TPA: helix-turn-helix transcriptional regulator [Gammaproteobacteria bacterium]|nr:helix-turn-helix transcriptional regulator [Gammaproteobacteria bacterium]